jgi:hypothetical protein
MTIPSSNLAQRTEEIINFDKRIFFILLVAIFLIIRYLTYELILQSIPGHRILEGEGALTYFHIFNSLNYLLTPFSLLWKFTLTAFTLWIGGFMAGYKLSFRSLWQFTMVAEVIFILPELLRLLWFVGVVEPENFQEIESFHPLSLYSLLNSTQLDPKYHYPLKAINLFELAYWGVLVIGVHTISRKTFNHSLLIVLGSYTLCFFLWLGFYMAVYKS